VRLGRLELRHLIRLILIRYLKVAPARTLLTLFGVSLGVAVIFAIDAINGSVMASFRGAIDGVAGKTALTVGAGSGVAEELLEPVRAVVGVEAAVPVIEESALDVKGGVQLAVLGVDTLSDSKVRDYDVTAQDVQIEDDLAFLNDPHGVLITRAYAQRHGLKPGDELLLETVSGRAEFTVRGMLAPRGPAKVFGGDLLLMDVYAAQIAFGRGKRFDRIDVVPSKGTDTALLAQRIAHALLGKVSVSRPERRSQEAERILAGFKLGLSLASFVAIFVGGFIVYNALAIAVAQRRREIGILRSLGATRAQILALFVGEGLLFGTLGAALGLGLGFALARGALRAVGATVSALFLQVRPEHLVVTPRQLVSAAAFGVAAAFVAAFFPARRAAAIEPASAMRKKVEVADVALSSPAAALKAAGAALWLALVIAWIAHVRENFMLGYAVAAILAFATAFLSPLIASAVGKLAKLLALRVGPAVRLGAVSFERSSGRNSVAIAALGMALANVINASAFLDSMKHSTGSWFNRSLRADIFVFAGHDAKAQYSHPLPEWVGAGLSTIPGVELVDPVRMLRQSYRGRPFYIISYDLLRYRRYNEIPVVAGDLEPALKEIAAGTGIAASETFARAFGVGIGDTLALQTPEGPREFRVSLVYVDYNSDLGVLCTTRDVYTRVWKDRLVDSFGIYLAKSAALAHVRERIAHDWGASYHLMVLGNREYKGELMKLLDSSFALMRATEMIAVIVAILGIVNTLLVTVLDRRMELGILKAIGASASQVQRMFITEACLIGFCATLVGIGFGSGFSAYLVKELIRFQVGWHLSWQLSIPTVLESLVLAQLVAVVAAWWPMRSAVKLDVSEALQYE
jgi:putative ABC transport system permease protein